MLRLITLSLDSLELRQRSHRCPFGDCFGFNSRPGLVIHLRRHVRHNHRLGVMCDNLLGNHRGEKVVAVASGCSGTEGESCGDNGNE